MSPSSQFRTQPPAPAQVLQPGRRALPVAQSAPLRWSAVPLGRPAGRCWVRPGREGGCEDAPPHSQLLSPALPQGGLPGLAVCHCGPLPARFVSSPWSDGSPQHSFPPDPVNVAVFSSLSNINSMQGTPGCFSQCLVCAVHSVRRGEPSQAVPWCPRGLVPGSPVRLRALEPLRRRRGGGMRPPAPPWTPPRTRDSEHGCLAVVSREQRRARRLRGPRRHVRPPQWAPSPRRNFFPTYFRSAAGRVSVTEDGLGVRGD